MSDDDGWGDRCPNCGARYPVLHGPHPTWIPCDAQPTPDDERA